MNMIDNNTEGHNGLMRIKKALESAQKSISGQLCKFDDEWYNLIHASTSYGQLVEKQGFVIIEDLCENCDH